MVADLQDEQAVVATARRRGAPVVSLTASDVALCGLYVTMVGLVTFFIGGQMPHQSTATWLGLWLFGLVCGVGGAVSRDGSDLTKVDLRRSGDHP